MDTATGKSYPELADDCPEVLNDEHTKFRIKISPGVFWSDGVEFTADDVIYTLDTYFAGKGKLTYFGVRDHQLRQERTRRSTTTPSRSRPSTRPTTSRP